MAKKEAALKPKQRGRFAAAFFQTLKCWQLIVMVLPAVIIIVLFNYVPMYGVTMAFQNYSPSLGFSNSLSGSSTHSTPSPPSAIRCS